MSRNKRNNRPQRSDDGDAFIRESALSTGAGDDLAQQLAETHQRAVTTGEDDAEEDRDALQTEELGGPFIVSRAEEEFGETMTAGSSEDWDDPDAETNALPEAIGSLAIASAEEAEEERESVEAREEETGDADLPDRDAEPPSRVEPHIAGLAREERAPGR
jgi:hypothetical protein